MVSENEIVAEFIASASMDDLTMILLPHGMAKVIARHLEAAEAARPSVPQEPGVKAHVYGYFVKDLADGWIFFDNKADADMEVIGTGAMMLAGVALSAIAAPVAEPVADADVPQEPSRKKRDFAKECPFIPITELIASYTESAPKHRMHMSVEDARRIGKIRVATLDNLFSDQAAMSAPVAVRHSFDGHGYQYIDSGSGSDWLTRHADGEKLYTAPPEKPVAEVPGSIGELLEWVNYQIDVAKQETTASDNPAHIKQIWLDKAQMFLRIKAALKRSA